MNLSQSALVFVVLAPGVVFGVFALLWLLGWVPGERVVSRITGLTFSACVIALVVLVWKLASTGAAGIVVTFGNWFAVHDYRFPLVLMADRLSLPFLAMTVVLSGLIGQFSATYLHRERGFFRFFLFSASVRVRILTRIRRRFVRSARRGMGAGGHHFGVVDRIFPASSGPGRERSARLRRVSRLRHRIAGRGVSPCTTGREPPRLMAVFRC